MATQPQKKKPGTKATTAAPNAGASPAVNPVKDGGTSPFPGKPGNPATGAGNNPFTAASGPKIGLNMPPFNMPPFGPPMPNAMPFPQGMMPPQGMMGMPPAPGFGAIPAAFAGGGLFNSLGNMLRLGVDTINSALAGSNQLVRGLTGGGQPPYPCPQPYYPQSCGCHHGHMRHGCGHSHQHNTYHDCGCRSCCDVYGESCCNPGVHNCC